MSRNVLIRALHGGLSIVTPIALLACSSSSSGGGATGDATAGLTAVTKYGCKSCHGADMSGSTTVYPGTKAYAANLTPDKETGLGDWDTATIKTAVLTGKDDEGKQLCSTMPMFQDMKMTDTEANDIVAYLKSLTAVKKEVPESECSSGGAAGMGAGAAGTTGAAGSK